MKFYESEFHFAFDLTSSTTPHIVAQNFETIEYLDYDAILDNGKNNIGNVPKVVNGGAGSSVPIVATREKGASHVDDGHETIGKPGPISSSVIEPTSCLMDHDGNPSALDNNIICSDSSGTTLREEAVATPTILDEERGKENVFGIPLQVTGFCYYQESKFVILFFITYSYSDLRYFLSYSALS